ncbi:FxsA family protein [Pseudonocardia sp. T1-2H]|uniref:FxsA family protein n=1 Tax=Pseudonocardia sp. T1-2H TaxID=3128899 RepID=UPI0031018B31
MPFVLLYLVVEIAAFIALGSWIGFAATLLVVLASSVIGLLLARREGLRAAQAFAEAARSREVAHSEMTDGMLVAAGGVLLFVPGLVTDVLGLLLVLPPTRALVRRRIVASAERRSPGLRTARIRSEGPIVDAEVVGEPTYDGGPRRRPDAAGPTVIEGTIVD